MKWTPQKAIVSAPARGGLLGEAERVADVVGHVLDLGHLVVVGEDHGVALAGQLAHLVLERAHVLAAMGSWMARRWAPSGPSCFDLAEGDRNEARAWGRGSSKSS